MEEKTILVTGIGGNVGQGIIRNIRATDAKVNVVGCNVTAFSAGNHLCDKFYEVPFSYHDDYVPTIKRIVKENDVDLILPSTDYEVYYLAKHRNEIECVIATSDVDTAKVYLDKYDSFLHHAKYDIPFAKSYLPSGYDGSLKSIIVKPREGRGSRGITLNPTDLSKFSDDYMIQELHEGAEVTTAFYVNKNNELHGFISLERKLDNGATSECRVVTDYDNGIKEILLKVIKHSNIKGAANLQMIITPTGEIFPFEINCRISGTNSIRSNFGFEDVKYTLEEYLYNTAPTQPKIISGVAVRILMDVIYPNVYDNSDLKDNSSKFFIY
jgi:carbamoyl-phosphate synthase large subunit